MILKIISYWNPIESEGSEVIIKWCHPHFLRCISLPAKTSNCCYVPRGRWYSQPFLGAGKHSLLVLVRPLRADDICPRLCVLPLLVGIAMEERESCPVGCIEFFLFLKKTISHNHCQPGELMWFSLWSAVPELCGNVCENPCIGTMALTHDASQPV